MLCTVSKPERKEKYKATRLKRKNSQITYIAVSPRTNGCLPSRLGLGTYQAKFILEVSLPFIDINSSIVKDDTVSCTLDYPTPYYKNFSKYGIIKISSSL